MPLCAALLAGIIVLLIGWPWRNRRGVDVGAWAWSLQKRQVSARTLKQRRQPLWVRLVPGPLEAAIRRERLVRLRGPDPLARQLTCAGLEGIVSAEQFACLRVAAPVGLFGGLILLYLLYPAPFRLVLAVVGLAVGAILPNHWLRQRLLQQQEAVKRELPTLLTTLGVLLDAGINLIPALKDGAARREGVLPEVVEDALRKTALGTPIGESLQQAADHLGVQEFTFFVSALVQAMEKGAAGVSEAVRGQARQMWELRQQQVEAKGQEMSQDLFFILLCLAFPAILLFFLGPVGLSLYRMFF